VLQLRFEPRTGRRRLVGIFEVTGLEGDVVTGNDLWVLDAARDRLSWTGIQPRCLAKIAARGITYAPPPAVERARRGASPATRRNSPGPSAGAAG
jgi:hypothetical protein